MQSSTKGNYEPRPKGAADELIIQSLAKLDALAFGVSIGTVLGFGVFFATNILVWKGGDVVGPRLGLLANYFIGYDVTPIGSLIGFAWGFVTGFLLGWIGAGLRNLIVNIYMNVFKLRGRMTAVRDFIDNP
ncbi:MAG: hypothetical protein DWQ47_01935 [Acidobacteria bacterium]|nr:MAG: hypothetical protein DWQ32_05485 [Acidobacteriota bacterium]REK01184.1 MAG: hypothetical protein DWQ38_01920 [Acidobacteriota bacterium]REK14140.1 MAG: hypothetical protein DWQ43_11175 [Acidobacteriota bacterium]REK44855.1 MAG: hypothetical protein DWQ47_01935 [Acidobacteriota bacterium]